MKIHILIVGMMLVLITIGISGCIGLIGDNGIENAYYSYYFSRTEKTDGETTYLYVYVHMKIKNEDLQCGVSTKGEDWRFHVNNIEYISYQWTSDNSTIYPGENYNFTITYRLEPKTNTTYAFLTYHNKSPEQVWFIPYHKMKR